MALDIFALLTSDGDHAQADHMFTGKAGDMRDVADVLDAVSQAKRIPRMELVNSILQGWADEKLHEAILVVRVTRSEG